MAELNSGTMEPFFSPYKNIQPRREHDAHQPFFKIFFLLIFTGMTTLPISCSFLTEDSDATVSDTNNSFAEAKQISIDDSTMVKFEMYNDEDYYKIDL